MNDQSVVDAVKDPKRGGDREGEERKQARPLVELSGPSIILEDTTKKGDKKKQQEPSLKWKKLGMDEQK